MKNRILFCAIFALLMFAFSPVGRAASPTTKPVNILWLSFEDSSPWFACYGDKTAPTPNIDRLVREGVHYTNAFSTSPVCAPSRNTIITGMYASQTGGLHHRNGKQGKEEGGAEGGGGRARRAQKFDIPIYEAVPPPEVRCFPEYLRMAGYYATNNVKQDYQFVAPPTVWDESSGKADYSKRAAGQPFFAVYNNVWTHESQVFPGAERRANVVKPLRLRPGMHRYLPALASQLGGRVAEVEVRHRPRLHGRSKYGLSRTFRVIADLSRLRALMQQATDPLTDTSGLYEIAEIRETRLHS